MTMAIFKSATEAIYIGYATTFADYSPTVTFSYNVGYIMSTD